MLIIFNLPFFKQLLPTILLALLTTTHSQTCQLNNFTTPYTQCLIQINRCFNQNTITHHQQSAHYQFQSCQIKHCTRVGAGNSECAQYITLSLSETQCYRSCCRTDEFNPVQCLVNNDVLKSQNQIADQYLFICLGLCVLGLVITIAYFAVKVIGCFERRQPLVLEQKTVPVWRKHSYRDYKCNYCHQYGAVLETPCQHYFHFPCLKKVAGEGKMDECPFCKACFGKWRLWCSDCHEKCLKVVADQFESVDNLQTFYWQGRILHNDCSMDMYCSGKTDVRLTCSTND